MFIAVNIHIHWVDIELSRRKEFWIDELNYKNAVTDKRSTWG
jgi:hypothetical protein